MTFGWDITQLAAAMHFNRLLHRFRAGLWVGFAARVLDRIDGRAGEEHHAVTDDTAFGVREVQTDVALNGFSLFAQMKRPVVLAVPVRSQLASVHRLASLRSTC